MSGHFKCSISISLTNIGKHTNTKGPSAVRNEKKERQVYSQMVKEKKDRAGEEEENIFKA